MMQPGFKIELQESEPGLDLKLELNKDIELYSSRISPFLQTGSDSLCSFL